jgi:hypothetical protein
LEARSIIQRQIQVGWQLHVLFTEGVFEPANSTLKDALADGISRKVLLVIDGASQAPLQHRDSG